MVARAEVVAPLESLGLSDLARAGGKAVRLGEMLRAGLPVPGGACVLVAGFEAWMAGRSRPADDAPVPLAVARELSAYMEAFGEQARWAVRSSATAEDLPEASFAGQQDTILDVQGVKAVLEAVKACWRSLYAERAVAYRQQHLPEPDAVAMAVVVQRFVPAEAAGVIFTVDPVSGSSDHLVAEAVPGLGEALVSGHAEPDRWLLRRKGLEIERETLGEGRGEACLAPGQVQEIASLALRVEALFDGPQDVEWALAGGAIHLLQARPITALPRPRAEGPVPVWSNVNTGELLPEVACPMTWSFVHLFIRLLFGRFATWLDVDLDREPFIGLVAGRVYANVGTFSKLLRSLPTPGELELSTVFGGAMAESEVAEAVRRYEESLPPRRFAALKTLLRLPSVIFFLLRSLPAHRGDRLLARLRRRSVELVATDLRTLGDAELLHCIGPGMQQGLDIPDIMAFAATGMSCHDLVFKLTLRWLGDEGGAIANRLISSAGNMESAEAAMAIWRLAREARQSPVVAEAVGVAADFTDLERLLGGTGEGRSFLSQWAEVMAAHGHHAQAELDVAQPRWAEQPDLVLGMLRGWMRAEVDPEAEQARRSEERERLLVDVRRRLGWLRWWFFALVLHRARRGLVLRENFKSEAIRLLFVARRALLEVGRRLTERGILAEVDDVFFLYREELDPLISGQPPTPVAATLAARKAEHRRNARLHPPPVVLGEYDPWADEGAGAIPEGKVLHGLAVSPGVVVGPARVLLRADGDEQVLDGEILVAPYTDPGWTPCFLTAAGLVVDIGGMLSHGSIVAREYGLPAVVNVGPATRVFKTGQMLRVDGDHGVVEMVDAE